MQIFVSRSSEQIVQAVDYARAVTELSFKRRTRGNLGIVFSDGSAVVELPGDATGKAALKTKDVYTSDALALGTWTKTGTGSSTVYVVDWNLNTIAINRAFVDGTIGQVVADETARFALTGKAVGDIVEQTDTGEFWAVIDEENLGNAGGWGVAPEKISIDCMFEIEWSESAEHNGSTATVYGKLYNDVIRGDEGLPTLGVNARQVLRLGLDTGVSSGSVVFSPPMSGAPVVALTVSTPSGESGLAVWTVGDPDADGFDFELSGLTESANAKLNVIAELPS